MEYHSAINQEFFTFKNLKILLAKASPARSADELAGIAAESEKMRLAAQCALAEVPLKQFLEEPLIPYEEDEVTRLILDSHDAKSFSPIAHFTVGEFRDWLLSAETTTEMLTAIQTGLTPEMVAAVSKLMRIQDLISVAKKCVIVTAFRNTIGLPGHFSTRLQPNHPTDDLKGILISTLDGLLLGNGDAVIGVNPAADNPSKILSLLTLLDNLRLRFDIPTQSCVLTHITTTLALIEKNAPIDLVFQSISGSEKANNSFGVNLKIIEEAQAAALALNRGNYRSLHDYC